MEQQSWVVDEEQPFSQSKIWEIQESYYLHQGIAAWTKIPFYPTNNTFIAATYADMILAFLSDYQDTLTPTQPVYVVEVAAGIGQFSFYLIRELLRKQVHIPALKDLHFCVVITDFVQANVDFWQRHERFQPYIESQHVDFALFAPDRQDQLDLIISKTTLKPEALKNPLIVLGNYYVDTIRQDIFRILGGQLEQMMLTVSKKPDPSETEGPPGILDLNIDQAYRPVSLPLYADEAINCILQTYREQFEQASIILPIGGFQTIQNLLSLSQGNLFLILADKGFNDAAYQDHREAFQAVIHGAMSFMVNFDALGRYIELQGGRSHITTDRSSAIHILAAVLMGEAKPRTTTLNYLFAEHVDRQNPINSIFYIQRMMDEANRNSIMANVDACLSIIRLGYADPVIFSTCADMIFQQTEDLTYEQRQDLLRLLHEAEDHFYFVPTGQNLSYWFGKLYLGLGIYDKSARWFEHALVHHGRDVLIVYQLANAYEGIGDREKAISCYQEALALMPELTEAQEAIDRLQQG